MKLNWNFISKIFARTVGVENLSRDAEGHEVLSADQRKILEQKFGPEALQHYDAYPPTGANDDAQQEQLLLNFLDAIGRSGGDDKDKLRQELAKAEIAANVHYKPLPLLTAYKNMGFAIEDFPNAYRMYENEISLPLHSCLTDEQQQHVIDTFQRLLREHGLC